MRRVVYFCDLRGLQTILSCVEAAYSCSYQRVKLRLNSSWFLAIHSYVVSVDLLPGPHEMGGGVNETNRKMSGL